MSGLRRWCFNAWHWVSGGPRARSVTVVAVVVGLVAIVVTWAVWPSDPPEQPRAREYRDITFCLLTDGQGVAGPAAVPVWEGMEKASEATLVRVQYQAVIGPDTVANALPYLAGLIQGQCGVIFAVGPSQVGAVAVHAPRFPEVRFVVVGGQVSGTNVTRIDAVSASEVSAAVQSLVAAEAKKVTDR